MFHYEIIFPPPAQVERRRHQLDQAGFQAWLSPIVLLAGLWLYRILRSRPPSADRSKAPTALQIFQRRIAWVMNDVYILEFGPLHVQFVAAAYASWLVYLVFRHTGNDYLHLTKGFGHVAVSQLPLHYLLAFKSPLSPITLATGLTHERLNAYHRVFGRIVHTLLGTHAVLYLRFFIVKDLLGKRIQDRDVRLGILAFWLFNFLGVLALPIVRRKAYHRLFFQSHLLLGAVIPVVLFFHVPYTRRYVLQAGVFWLANGVLRTSDTEKVKIRCTNVEDTSLMQLSFDVGKARSLFDWIPGQHLYLRRGVMGAMTPFTIVGQAADGEEDMSLVVRDLDGPQTGFLGGLAETGEPADMMIEGPYGEASEYMPRLLQENSGAGQIVAVAGGVGATYTLPVYLALIAPRGGSVAAKMLWFVKSLADASWGIEMIRQANKPVDVDIYVTGRAKLQTNASSLHAIKGVSIFAVGSRPALNEILEPILIPKSDRDGNVSLVTSSKRDPRKMKRNYEKITFLVCGPRTLSESVRTEVGKHVVGYGRHVDWFEEQFGLGGS